MKIRLLTLSLPLTILAFSGCTHTTADNLPPPGHYEGKSTAVDPHGTKTETKTDTNVFYDENGNKKAIVNKKTTSDPKGLFNKTTAEENKVVE